MCLSAIQGVKRFLEPGEQFDPVEARFVVVPREAREADVGLTGATPNNLIYVAGEPDHKINNEDFLDHLARVVARVRGRVPGFRPRAASQRQRDANDRYQEVWSIHGCA